MNKGRRSSVSSDEILSSLSFPVEAHKLTGVDPIIYLSLFFSTGSFSSLPAEDAFPDMDFQHVPTPAVPMQTTPVEAHV